MRKVYESRGGIKVFLNDRGKYDVVDFVNYFYTIKDVENLGRAKRIAKLVEDRYPDFLEDEYRILHYDEPVKLLFHRGKKVYGKTSPDRDVVEVAGPNIEHKVVTLAHEMGHVATGVGSGSNWEKKAWAWAIPRLIQSGLWSSGTRRRVISRTSLRSNLEMELAFKKQEPFYSPSRETKNQAKVEVEKFLSTWPVTEA